MTEDTDDTQANATTNQGTATVVFGYTGADLAGGERFQYSTNGGNTWVDVSSVDTTANTVTISGLNVTSSPTITLNRLILWGTKGHWVARRSHMTTRHRRKR